MKGDIARKITKNHTGVAHDASEQIVKVMSNASGQHTETLQFLHLQKPFIEALPLRHITAEDRKPIAGGTGIEFKPGIKRFVVLLELGRHGLRHHAFKGLARSSVQLRWE